MSTPPHALERIEDCRNNRSTSLDLSKLGLIQIPKEIYDFFWLENLNFTYNSITKIEGLDNLINISKLYLNSNQITKIEGLDNLTNISILYLNSNQITKIEGLDNLINISELALYSNQITKIEGLDNLINISILYLSHNQITKIEDLNQLVNISILDLSHNHITKIEDLDQLVNISELDLSLNYITKIEGLNNLTNVLKLTLFDLQITKIEGLNTLINISSLNLRSNRINKIENLDELINISKLYLSRNNIKKIEGLNNLKKLTELDISNNNINKIEGIDTLINLKLLDISINQIENIEGLNSLKSLNELLLHSNNLQKIEGLEGLENLSVLIIAHNQINTVEGLNKLKNISELRINSNPLEIKYNLILKEFENHWEIIKNIIDRDAEEGKDDSIILPAKIILLGNHASGKSSLLHYLQNQNLEYCGNSTHLLKVEHYPDDTNPDAIFYDFGGQDYYHGIYRAFLSSGSVYLLLWNKDNNENKITPDSKGLQTQNFKVSYWLGQKKHLETSKYKNEQGPILLIQTHAQDAQIPMSVPVHQDNAVQNTFYVSLSKKYNLNKNKAALFYLKAEIDALIDNKKRKRNEKEWYGKFYEYVLNEKEVQAFPINNLLTYYTPKNKTNIGISLQAELQQFHNQGLVLYYPDIDDSIVWLNPAGLVEYVHNNILKEDIISKFEGKVHEKQLSSVDKNIIALLKKQKVLFEHQYGDNGVEYIVPNFLPLVKNNETEYDLFTFGLNNPLFTLKFGQFLPIGLINQMICFFGKQPDKKKFWRDQLLFTFEGKCKVLIRLDFELLEIKVLVSFLETTKSNEQEQIGKYLFYCIMSMYWDFEPILFYEYLNFHNNHIFIGDGEQYEAEFKEKSSVKESTIMPTNLVKYLDYNYLNIIGEEKYHPKDLYVSRDDKYFVKYTLLEEHDTKETRIVSHTLNNDRTLSVKMVEIFVKPFELFTNKKMTAMKKVFISYSKDDLSLVHRFRDALIPLHDDGIIESPWYCTFLEAGSLWDAEIQQKLRESDIVFFMCSMSFIRTKYIREHEIKTAIEENKTIIPVILNFCEWDRYLGVYTALPYTSKPVADFNNQDLAWLLVTKGVRMSLEETKKDELDKQVRKLYERLVEGKLDKNE